jgi:hypothetical protein
MKAPKPLLMLIGGLFGVTARFVKRNVGYSIKLNTTKSRVKLGLEYRSFDETIKDMVNQMHELGIV